MTATKQLSVCNFNIRRDARKDGAQQWEHRRQLCADVIFSAHADIICLQEALVHQLDYLAQQLVPYTWHGAGRKDGRRSGEFVPIFYKAERFSPMRSGNFWLSETPTVPGSKSWNTRRPRMCSWILLYDHAAAEKNCVLVVNTHFDHVSAEAREQSARMIVEHIQSIDEKDRILLCGDFNCAPGSTVHKTLLQGNILRDAHAQMENPVGTSHQYTGRTDGTRIDWILHSANLNVKNASINTNKLELYPSDHFPVFATFTLE